MSVKLVYVSLFFVMGCLTWFVSQHLVTEVEYSEGE